MQPYDDDYTYRPPPPPPPAFDLALAVRALEYTRGFAEPDEPLGAYVLAMDAPMSEPVARRIPWTHATPRPRVVIEDRRLVVGWTSLAVLGTALERFAPAQAEDVRHAAASDVALWTTVHVHKGVTVARVARDELLAVETWGARPTQPDLPEAARASDSTGPAFYPSFADRCRLGDKHDGRGPHYVAFDENGRLALVARTCVKCGKHSADRP